MGRARQQAKHLEAACVKNDVDLIRQLHRMGTDIDLECIAHEMPPVCVAVKYGSIDAIEILVALGADLNVRTKTGFSLIYVAAENNKPQCIRLLAKLGVKINDDIVSRGLPIFIAAQRGFTEVVNVLAELGADIERVIADGMTPLFIASQNGHAATVDALALAGADINAARTIAAGVTPIFISAAQGHGSVVQSLVQLGADVNSTTPDGTTPVYLASEGGHDTCIRILTSYGADLNVPTVNGQTALYIACLNGLLDAVQALIEGGANIDAQTTDGTTAAFVASENGHAACLRILAAAGADLNLARHNGRSPLYAAWSQSHVNCFNILVELGADLTCLCSSILPPTNPVLAERLHRIKVYVNKTSSLALFSNQVRYKVFAILVMMSTAFDRRRVSEECSTAVSGPDATPRLLGSAVLGSGSSIRSRSWEELILARSRSSSHSDSDDDNNYNYGPSTTATTVPTSATMDINLLSVLTEELHANLASNVLTEVSLLQQRQAVSLSVDMALASTSSTQRRSPPYLKLDLDSRRLIDLELLASAAVNRFNIMVRGCDLLRNLLHLRLVCTTTARSCFPVPHNEIQELPVGLIESFIGGDGCWDLTLDQIKRALSVLPSD